MTAALVRADALAIPLRDASVDLIVTSPPYWALRSYQDDGEHMAGQIGSEDRPRAFLEALWAVTAECKRVLKPGGSIFVNLGDKYAGSGSHNNATLSGSPSQRARAVEHNRGSHDAYNKAADVQAKSLMGLPWLYALGCTGALAALGGADPGLDLVLRSEIVHSMPDPGLDLLLAAEIVWDKPNGLPESVTDRVRRSHEQWFHLVKSPRYYAAVDEVREPHAKGTAERYAAGYGDRSSTNDERTSGYDLGGTDWTANPLGKLPGSVWRIPGEPLQVPEWLPQHFAAFPQEWPRRLILGWSPPGWCTACGQPRRPIVEREQRATQGPNGAQKITRERNDGGNPDGRPGTVATITGYRCACPDTTAPTTPAVVLDPFGGTGTTAMVARSLHRTGISLDLSADYHRLARWRIFDSGHAAKTRRRTNAERQGELL